MSDGKKRGPGRPRSEASREAILDAAYWQTMARGYPNVTAELIARAAGAGKQTLYRWWPSKAAIILEAFAEMGRARIDRPQEAAIRAGDLLGFLRTVFAAAGVHGAVLRHLMAEAQFDPKLRGLLRKLIVEPRSDALRRALEQRIRDANRREAMVAAIDGAIWRRLLLDEPLDDAFAVQLATLAEPDAN